MIADLQSHAPPSHNALNALFAEVERKLGLLLNGRSPLLVAIPPGDIHALHWSDLFGKRFSFWQTGEPDHRQWTTGDTLYDHSIYTAAVAAATVNGTDDDNHIAWVTLPGAFLDAPHSLDDSLEAHKLTVSGQVYYVGQGAYDITDEAGDVRLDWYRPERRQDWAVAEIVIEQWTGDFTIPTSYDKYRFFRIHNLNLTGTLTVKFGTEFSLSIPALSCRTVRITRGPTNSCEVSTYLWKVHAGDPRYCQPPYGDVTSPPPSSLWSHAPELFSPPNNTCHPAIVSLWLDELTRPSDLTPLNSFGFRLDPSILEDWRADYASCFADPRNSATKLFDLLYHRGALMVIKTAAGGAVTTRTCTFNGYDTLAATLAPEVTVTTLEDGSLGLYPADPTSTVDLVALGTSLLQGAGQTNPNAITLPANLSGPAYGIHGLATTLRRGSGTTTQTVSAPYYGHDDVTGNYTVTTVEDFAVSLSPVSLPLNSTVAELLAAVSNYGPLPSVLWVSPGPWSAPSARNIPARISRSSG